MNDYFKGNYFEEDFKTYDKSDWMTSTWSNAKSNWNKTAWNGDNLSHNSNNDTLTLRLGSEDDRGKDYSGSEFQSTEFYHFGIYEVQMKAAGVSGVNSNFFTFTGSAQGTVKNEIDFEFLGKTPTKVWTSFHSPIANDPDAGYKGRGKNVDLGFDASKGTHTYRFEWTTDSIKWYADGKLIRSVDAQKDTWLENGKYQTSYNSADGDTGAEIGIPQLPGKMYASIWHGAPEWMGNTNSGFKEVTATYDNISYMSWAHPDAKSLSGGNGSISNSIDDDKNDNNNDDPDAIYDTASVKENGSVRIDLLKNDKDADGDNLEIVKVENVTNGSVKINGDGTVTFTPNQGFSGREDFSYTISDGDKTDKAWVGVTVQEDSSSNNAPAQKVVEETNNDDPDAIYDTASVKENGSVRIDLLKNDKDADGDNLEIVKVENVTNGSVKINGDGTVTFTPNQGFSGREDFSYTISDGDKTDKAWVGVTVQEDSSSNNAPAQNQVEEKSEYSDDAIVGTSGADRLRGTNNNDTFIDTAGQDRMWGSSGKDTFVFSKPTAFNGTDLVNDFNASADVINLSDLLDNYNSVRDNLNDYVDISVKNGFTILSVDVNGNNNFKDVVKVKATGLSNDADKLVDQGILDVGSEKDSDSSSNYVFEQATTSQTDVTLLGGSGRDILRGTNGKDVMNGQSNDGTKDKLYGNNGDDILFGGHNDLLNGGAGQDTFVLEQDASKQTVIEDFTLGKDTIDISNILKNVDPMDAIFSNFVSIETNENQGKTYLMVDQDGSGNGEAEIVARVDGLHKVNLDDLVASDGIVA